MGAHVVTDKDGSEGRESRFHDAGRGLDPWVKFLFSQENAV